MGFLRLIEEKSDRGFFSLLSDWVPVNGFYPKNKFVWPILVNIGRYFSYRYRLIYQHVADISVHIGRKR